MDEFKEFLEVSTIGGLNFIFSTKKFIRFFWISVVSASFAYSFFEIYNMFHDWQQNPIKTLSETLPSSFITYPNVTVCPPKDISLNLNYDIMNLEQKILDQKVLIRMLYSFQYNPHSIYNGILIESAAV